MEYKVYKELSQTSEGRKKVHEIMLQEVKAKIDKLVESAPDNNKDKLSKMMDEAYDKIEALGNGKLFEFFADEAVSTNNFIRYISDILRGNL